MTHGGAREGAGRKKKPICPRCKTRAKAKGLSYCKECKRYIQEADLPEVQEAREDDKFGVL